MADTRDIVIIGAGPGGYIAALRGVQLHRKITLIEEDRVGGTCMNYGCIPSKYLLHQTEMLREIKTAKTLAGPVGQISMNWAAVQQNRKAVVDRLVNGIIFLLERGKVEIIKGTAGLGPGRTVHLKTPEGERSFAAEAVILATGSRAAGLPFLRPDGKTVVTSTEALEFPEIPKSLLVIGAGAIGLEMGSIYQRLGTDVTVLEIMPTILPGSDREAASRLERTLKKQGLKILTQMRIENAHVSENGVVCKGVSLRTQAPFEYEAEKVLLAAGRKPNIEHLFDRVEPPQLDRGGIIKVNASLETSIPGVYAIGDVIGGKLLAHKAFHDAVIAVENASGLAKTVDYTAVPLAVFTNPEFASVGLTQEEAVEKGIKIKTGVFLLQASGRALTMDAADGMVKVVADEADRVIGAHLVAPAASEMMPVLTMAVSRGLTIKEVADIIYIHPTLSECIGEAALKARNEALHILNT